MRWLLIRKAANLRLLHQLLAIERVLNAQTHAQYSLWNRERSSSININYIYKTLRRKKVIVENTMPLQAQNCFAQNLYIPTDRIGSKI